MPLGNVPVGEEQLIDGRFVNGITQGHNLTYQSGVSAAGTSSQAAATQLSDLISVIEVDTVAANSGVALPPALQGMRISVYNNSAASLLVYPAIANNPVTAAQDTINNATSVTLAAHVGATYACAKNGVWFAA